MIAGRCISATREAQGSARVMGSCLAMGQAAGTLSALTVRESNDLKVRSITAARLRDRLREQGAVLSGTY